MYSRKALPSVPWANKWWTLGLVSSATLMLFAYVMMIPFALASIQHDLHATLGQLQWVVDAYTLTLAAFLLTAGSLADLRGRRRIFLAGIGIFTLGAACCALAPSATLLDLASGLQGVGAAAMLATSLALIAHAFPGRDRATAMGVWGTTIAAGLVAGPLLAGLLVGTFGWRVIYVVLIVLGLPTLALARNRMTESRGEGNRVDWWGLITLGGTLLALITALVEGNALGFGSVPILSLLVLAAVLLVAFVAVELHQAHPMLDLSLLRIPTFSGAALAALTSAAANFGLTFYIIIYMLKYQQHASFDAALRFLPITGVSLAVSPLSGRLLRRISPRWLLTGSLVLIGIGNLVLRGISGIDETTTYPSLLLGFILVGAGAGAINPPLGATAVGVVPHTRAGMASGVNNTCRQIGTALGIAGFGAIFTSQVASRLTSLVPAHDPVVGLVSSGSVAAAIAASPPGTRAALSQLAPGAFLAGLNTTLVAIAIVAFVGAVLAALLVRSGDFVGQASEPTPTGQMREPALER
jgi:MFS family permease